MPLHLGKKHAIVGHRPVFQVALDPVGKLLEKYGQLSPSWARAISAAQISPPDDGRERRRRIAGVLFPALLVGNGRVLDQETRRAFDERENVQLPSALAFHRRHARTMGNATSSSCSPPVGPAVYPEILGEAAIGLLRARQIDQSPASRFRAPHASRRRPSAPCPGPHQVIAAQVVVAVGIAPGNGCGGDKCAGEGFVFVRKQNVWLARISLPPSRDWPPATRGWPPGPLLDEAVRC